MASSMSSPNQGSAALSQTNSSVPSPSTTRWSSLRRVIHVVIPSPQATTARVSTPAVTPIHGHPLAAAASPAVLSTLDTPTHGHGDVVAQTLHESPLTPTLPRMSARATRRSGHFSASSATDADVQMHSLVEAAYAGLMTPPLEAEEADHGAGEDEHSESAESSRAASAVDESDEDIRGLHSSDSRAIPPPIRATDSAVRRAAVVGAYRSSAVRGTPKGPSEFELTADASRATRRARRRVRASIYPASYFYNRLCFTFISDLLYMTYRKPKNISNPSEKLQTGKSKSRKQARECTRPPLSSKENTKPASKLQEGTKRTVTVHWSKPEYHYATDLLLTAIEERQTTCAALGFDPQGQDETNGVNKTSGKVVHEHYTSLARVVFLESGRFPKYTPDDIHELAGVIKNRVIKLKALYRECREKLTATGAGLVDEDRESEFEPGSQLANIWDEIQHDFPWYKRMNALMRGHPLIDRSGVANSATGVDLDILDRRSKAEDNNSGRARADDTRHRAASSDVSCSDSDDTAGDLVSSTESTASGSDEVEDTGTKKRKSPSTQPSASAGPTKCRKGMLQHVQEIAAADRSTRLKMTAMRLKAKCNYKVEKERLRHDIEMARLEHEARERDKQREHELKLLAGQLELEHLRVAASRPSQGPSQSGLAPPLVANWAIDPALQS